MATTVDINGKKLLPIKEAISKVDYSKDYITRLAREQKIVATQIGRKWFVDIQSLKNYYNLSQAELEIKKRQLSDERKRELAVKSLRSKKQQKIKSLQKRKMSAIASLCLIVAGGVGVGVALESQYQDRLTNFTQLANVKTIQLERSLPNIERSEPMKLASSESSELVADFAQNVSHRELDSKEGLLLLPQNATTPVSPNEYFSDPVTVVYDDDGGSAVRRLNAYGDPFGPEIPFVVVPINSELP